MKKSLIGLAVCMLMLVSILLPFSTASSQQKTSNIISESQKESIIWNIRPGLIIGFFDSVTWDGDQCFLVSEGRTNLHKLPVTFVTPLHCHQLKCDQRIQLVNPKFCLIDDNFVIGFSKIFLPKSTISMHIIDQNEDENTITWVVDSIEGDSIWGGNMFAVLHTQYGQKYVGGYASGPYKNDYVSIGDQFSITTGIDGNYRVILMDDVSGRVLFRSPLLKF